MARNLDPAAFRSLVAEVADELGARRHETWTVASWAEDSYNPAGELAGPEGARLQVQLGYHVADKLTFTGIYPDGTCGHTYRASVSPERGARPAASAADSRVLRAGYLDLLPSKITQAAEDARREAERMALMTQVAALFGADETAIERGKMSLSPYLFKRGEVETGGGYGQEPLTLGMELHGISPATALAMLRVLANAPEVQARCCYQYGPGHDARLSRLGCLRQASRTGKPKYDEASALFDVWRNAHSDQDWQAWLGPAAQDIHAMWR
jgi:hypothetical protein